MTVSGNSKTRHVKKTNDQKEAGKKPKTFLKGNKVKDCYEICLAIYRLLCLGFTGGNGLTLKTVHDKLAVLNEKSHNFK